MELTSLINSWTLSQPLHTFYLPAAEAEVLAVEKEIGHKVPSSLRGLYLFSNGLNLLGSNLNVYPLRKSESRWAGLSNLSTQLRDWKWSVPAEVLIFADNGAELYFGVWLPETQSETFRNPIIEVGEGQGHCMSIVGTNLISFLVGWTAYYLLMYKAESAALDAIALPHSLRDRGLDDELFADLRRWADPGLPDPYPDPYRKGYTVEAFKKLFGTPH